MHLYACECVCFACASVKYALSFVPTYVLAQAHESADTVLGKIVWSKVVKDVLEGKGVLQTRQAPLDRHRIAPELKDFNMTRMEVGKHLDDKNCRVRLFTNSNM